jgi:hypothetical protein
VGIKDSRGVINLGQMKAVKKGSLAEWSKALALGASPKGRGFEPHSYQSF